MERINTTKFNDSEDLDAIFRDEEEGTQLNIRVTEEGLIMDAWEIDAEGNDRLVGTVGRMADEWWEYLSWRTDHLSVPDHGSTEAQDGK